MGKNPEIMDRISNNNSFSLVHWNCNSLFNKQIEFTDFLNRFKPDIVSLNETKIGDDRFENEPILRDLTDYYLIHKARYREQNGAGGVAILIKKT